MVDVDGRSSKDVSRFVSLLIFYGGGRGGGEEYYLPRVANSTCRKFEPDPPLLGDDVDLLVGRVPLLSSTRLYIYMYTYIQSIYIYKVKRNRAPIIAPGAASRRGTEEEKKRPV